MARFTVPLLPLKGRSARHARRRDCVDDWVAHADEISTIYPVENRQHVIVLAHVETLAYAETGQMHFSLQS